MEKVLMLKKVIKITPRSFAEHPPAPPLRFNSFHRRIILSFFFRGKDYIAMMMACRGSQVEIYEANLGQLFKLHYSSTLMRKISPASYKLKGIFLTNFLLSHSISMRRVSDWVSAATRRRVKMNEEKFIIHSWSCQYDDVDEMFIMQRRCDEMHFD